MPTPRRRAGRLTRAEAARRAERVVEVATSMFLERGFDATSMEAVAGRPESRNRRSMLGTVTRRSYLPLCSGA